MDALPEVPIHIIQPLLTWSWWGYYKRDDLIPWFSTGIARLGWAIDPKALYSLQNNIAGISYNPASNTITLSSDVQIRIQDELNRRNLSPEYMLPSTLSETTIRDIVWLLVSKETVAWAPWNNPWSIPWVSPIDIERVRPLYRDLRDAYSQYKSGTISRSAMISLILRTLEREGWVTLGVSHSSTRTQQRSEAIVVGKIWDRAYIVSQYWLATGRDFSQALESLAMTDGSYLAYRYLIDSSGRPVGIIHWPMSTFLERVKFGTDTIWVWLDDPREIPNGIEVELYNLGKKITLSNKLWRDWYTQLGISESSYNGLAASMLHTTIGYQSVNTQVKTNFSHGTIGWIQKQWWVWASATQKLPITDTLSIQSNLTLRAEWSGNTLTSWYAEVSQRVYYRWKNILTWIEVGWVLLPDATAPRHWSISKMYGTNISTDIRGGANLSLSYGVVWSTSSMSTSIVYRLWSDCRAEVQIGKHRNPITGTETRGGVYLQCSEK